MRRGLCVREQRTEALGLETKLFSVFHCERRQLLLVVIRGINATLHRGRNRQIVRFSEREHSPRIGSEIWLSTLEHYRKGENLHADQRDSMEGRLKLDAAPLLARRLTKSGVHGAVDLSGVVRTGREVANLKVVRRLHEAPLVLVSVGVPVCPPDHRRAVEHDAPATGFRCPKSAHFHSPLRRACVTGDA